jgi:hypothetical protein
MASGFVFLEPIFVFCGSFLDYTLYFWLTTFPLRMTGKSEAVLKNIFVEKYDKGFWRNWS